MHLSSSYPEPHLFKRVPRLSLGPIQVRSIERRLSRVNICLGWWNPTGTLENFPKGKEGEVNWDANISSDEIVYYPWLKNMETVKDKNYRKEG